MSKFHINKHGIPAPCRARPGNCPLGGDENHFDSMTDAQTYADSINEEKYGLFSEQKAISIEKYNKGSGNFNHPVFNREVNRFISIGALDEIKANEGHSLLTRDIGVSNGYILSSYIDAELFNMMSDNEPTYFDNDKDYKEKLSEYITNGVERFMNDYGVGRINDEYIDIRNELGDDIKDFTNKNFLDNSTLESEVKRYIKNKENSIEEVVTEIHKEENPLIKNELLNNVKKEQRDIQELDNKLVKFRDSIYDLDNIESYREKWPKEVSSMIVDRDENESLIAEFKEYTKQAQEDGNLYFNRMSSNK